MITNNIEAFNLASNCGIIGKYPSIKVDANGSIFINCENPLTDAEIFDVVVNNAIVIHQPIVEETKTKKSKTKENGIE